MLKEYKHMNGQFINVDEKSLKCLDWPLLITRLQENTKSKQGFLYCENLRPGVLDVVSARKQATAILELNRLQRLKSKTLPIPRIDGITDVLLYIEKTAFVDSADIANLLIFQDGVCEFIKFLEFHKNDFDHILNIFSQLKELKSWSANLNKIIDKKTKQLKDQASQDLMALRALKNKYKKEVTKILQGYLIDPAKRVYFQDNFVTLREGRFVLPLKSNFKGQISGIIHDLSQSEQTIFLEPQEIIEINNELKIIDREIKIEIEKIIFQIITQTKPFLSDMIQNVDLMVKADFLNAAQLLVERWKQNTNQEVCCFDVGQTVDIKGLSHPIMAIDFEMVANDISWKGCFVISGPNAGGKTVLLKSVSLSACLAAIGLPVPASSFVLPKDCQNLWVELGDDQSVVEHVSTFSSHLLRLKEILNNTQAGDLIFIDELASGTSPEEGQPLAQAIIEEFLQKKVFLLLTTHFGRIKQFSLSNEKVRIGAMNFDSDNNKSDYNLILDIPGESSAYETALSLDFPKSIITRAQELKGDVSEDFKQAILRLEESRKGFVNKKIELDNQLSEVTLNNKKLEKKLQDIFNQRDQMINQEAQDSLKYLRDIREHISKKAKEFSQSGNAQKIFNQISDGITSVKEKTISVTSEVKESFSADFNVGDWVEVQGLGLGLVEDCPRDQSKKKSVFKVKVGKFSTNIEKQRLFPAAKTKIDHQKNIQKQAAVAEQRNNVIRSTTAKRASSSCDLRGLRSNDAITKLDQWISKALNSDSPSLTIIHGHGTEVIKKAVRSHLKNQYPQYNTRTGSWPGEGGDGVTILEL